MLVDQTKDPGFAHLRMLVEQYPAIQEMCKTASLDPESFDALPKEAFAWPEKRMFPIHNREQTALSVGYCKLASDVPKHVRQTLADAAELYDIPAETYVSTVKEAEETVYLLPDQKRFAVKTAADVQEAEQMYHHRYAQLSTTDRIEVGYNLMKVAEQHRVVLSPSTQKMAGFTMTSTAALRDCLRARAVAAEKVASPIAPVFAKMAASFNNAQPYINDHGEQVKLAWAIEELDRKAGITKFYDRTLYDPMRSVFNTEKFAAEFFKTAGVLQNKSLLQKLPMSFWQDALGDDIAKEIAPGGSVDYQMLEQILPTLPADMKATLERQLAAYR